MPNRAALLICCSASEAAAIRDRARLDHRGISSYLLATLLPSITFEETLYARYHRLADLGFATNQGLANQGSAAGSRGQQPRAALLLRCSKREAARIRAAAHRRDTSISRFVLYILARAWAIRDRRNAQLEGILASQSQQRKVTQS